METRQQINALNSGNLDVGFMRRLDSYPIGIAAFNIARQRYCVALHRDHPLADKKAITAEVLAKQKFVSYSLDAEIGFWRNILAVLPPGAAPEIVQRAPDAISLLILVSANVGIAIVPESFKSIAGDSVVTRNISGPPKYLENVVVYRVNETAPAVALFLKTVRRALEAP